MKMKKNLVALCLSAGLLACVPGVTLADVNYVPQNTSAAPASHAGKSGHEGDRQHPFNGQHHSDL